MKYVLTWWERPGGSYADYEAAQKRVLNVFEPWEMPESLDIHQFVVRVGEFGGYSSRAGQCGRCAKTDCDLCGLPVPLEPVMDVMDAAHRVKPRGSLGAIRTRRLRCIGAVAKVPDTTIRH